MENLPQMCMEVSMKAKELLNRVKEIKKEIEIKSRLAMTYRDIATGLQSPQYTDMPKNPNRKLQPMADALDKVMAFEEEIELLKKEIIEVKEHIYQVIQHIEIKEHQLILLERYVNERTWSQIIKTIGYSRSRLFEKHNDALLDFSVAFEKFGLSRTRVDYVGH